MRIPRTYFFRDKRPFLGWGGQAFVCSSGLVLPLKCPDVMQMDGQITNIGFDPNPKILYINYLGSCNAPSRWLGITAVNSDDNLALIPRLSWR